MIVTYKIIIINYILINNKQLYKLFIIYKNIVYNNDTIIQNETCMK